ncbi:uncharacterized protein BCR38DRAFT_413284 [Pseudomassariella vexata]|uniref:Uncharacterized protein n=1 Tax=Pseudomassariella vexata TaxID=1141098 RepID=A0A1Y2DHY3_9PEZI|nr:uncharacterized protein BCR38DRAFT_413284 [Pseudomassariella vexata]ORY58415.1 hypothetical protein BCR38DRAFT_413284 [Pseudomassariella vexata]
MEGFRSRYSLAALGGALGGLFLLIGIILLCHFRCKRKNNPKGKHRSPKRKRQDKWTGHASLAYSESDEGIWNREKGSQRGSLTPLARSKRISSTEASSEVIFAASGTTQTALSDERHLKKPKTSWSQYQNQEEDLQWYNQSSSKKGVFRYPPPIVLSNLSGKKHGRKTPHSPPKDNINIRTSHFATITRHDETPDMRESDISVSPPSSPTSPPRAVSPLSDRRKTADSVAPL